MFKVVKTGKTKRKGWKRMVTKATFVGEVRSFFAFFFQTLPTTSNRTATDSTTRYRTLPVNRRSSSDSFDRQRCDTKRPTSPIVSISLWSFPTRSDPLCMCSRAQSNFPTAYYRCQEEPAVSNGAFPLFISLYSSSSPQQPHQSFADCITEQGLTSCSVHAARSYNKRNDY